MSWMLAAMPQDSIIVSRHQLSAADGRRELDIATALQGANHVMQLLQALAETSSTAGANDEPPVLTNLQMHMLMTHLLSKHQHCQPPDVHSSLDAGTALVLSICCSAYFLKAPPPPQSHNGRLEHPANLIAAWLHSTLPCALCTNLI
jgi:hypothetical protein